MPLVKGTTPGSGDVSPVVGRDEPRAPAPPPEYPPDIPSIAEGMTPVSNVADTDLGKDFAPEVQDFAPGAIDPADPVVVADDDATLTAPVGASAATVARYAGGATDFRDKVIANALGFLGTQYSWGGGNTRGTSTGVRGSQYNGAGINGLDCSGLMIASFGIAGFGLQRVARDQLSSGTRTSISNLRPGDLIGYGNGYHVALYLGDGKVVDSLPGKGVTVRDIGGWEAREGFGVRLNLPGD